MVGSWSHHARIGPALEMTFHLFSKIFSEISQCNFLWQAQYLVTLGAPVAPRTVNDVSYVVRMKHASLSAWQAQYLVKC